MIDLKVGDIVMGTPEGESEPMQGEITGPSPANKGRVWWVQFPDYARPIPMHIDRLTKTEPKP